MIRLLLFHFLLALSCTTRTEKSTNDKAEVVEKPQVAVTTLKKTEISDVLSFAGELRASDSQTIYAPNEGFVRAIPVKEGQSVKKGERLITLNPGTGSGYRDFVGIAALAGTVVDLPFGEGEKVDKNDKIAIIADMSSYATTVQATASDLKHLLVNKEVVVLVKSDPVFETKGLIKDVATKASSESHSFGVSISIPCVPQCPKLQLGLLTKVTVKTSSRMGFLLSQDVLRNGQSQVIVLTKEGKAHWVPVKTGKHLEKQIEVTEGLEEGQVLVTSFSKEPEEGQAVIIMSQPGDVLGKKP